MAVTRFILHGKEKAKDAMNNVKKLDFPVLIQKISTPPLLIPGLRRKIVILHQDSDGIT